MACSLGTVFGADKGCSGLFKRLEKHCDSWGGRDKTVKAVDAFTKLAAEISFQKNGAEHHSTIQARKFAKATSDARDVFALFNVLGGTLTASFKAGANVVKLAKQTDEDVWMRGEVEKGKTPSAAQELNRVERGKSLQRFLGVVEQIGFGTGAITYSVAFGICRVIRFIGKMLGDLGRGAKQMVKAFTPIMFANHIGGFLSSTAALVRLKLRLNDITADSSGSPLPEAFGLEYTKEVTGHALSLGEKGLELACDANRVFGAKIGSLPMAIMGAAIGLIGVVKAFAGGYEAPKIQ